MDQLLEEVKENRESNRSTIVFIGYPDGEMDPSFTDQVLEELGESIQWRLSTLPSMILKFKDSYWGWTTKNGEPIDLSQNHHIPIDLIIDLHYKDENNNAYYLVKSNAIKTKDSFVIMRKFPNIMYSNLVEKADCLITKKCDRHRNLG